MNAEDTVYNFLEIIKVLRAKENLSLEQVASKAGIDRSFLGLLERHERVPTLLVAEQIAQAFDYNLSDLLQYSEFLSSNEEIVENIYQYMNERIVDHDNIFNEMAFKKITGLSDKVIYNAINECYSTLDMIDQQLNAKGLPAISELVELANLSSMVGNLLGGAIAQHSEDLFKRNMPHSYPDLISLDGNYDDIEIKIALEKNKPKGHLPKEGTFLTFRYVLGDKLGNYKKGRENRGDTVWIWEVKVGKITESDYSVSNTSGDSGKTAVIKTDKFNKMDIVYLDEDLNPYTRYPSKI